MISKELTRSPLAAAQPREQRHRGAHVGHGRERRGARANLRKELQARRRDHPERALGAEEQRLDVVAGVVLAQCRERGSTRPSPARPRVPAPGRASCRSAARSTPPALVDRLPPIWQLPWEPRLRGKKRCARSAASCTCARTQPASAISESLATSTPRMRLSRSSDSTICCAALIGRRAAAVAGVAPVRYHADARTRRRREHPRDLLRPYAAARRRARAR